MSQKTLIDKQTILFRIKDVMFSSALAGVQCWLLMLHVPYWPSSPLFSVVLTLFHWGSFIFAPLFIASAACNLIQLLAILVREAAQRVIDKKNPK
ncbi:hypothetical protein DWV55_01520 [Butyricicoccus sp. AF10-3]|nr:MULTISPECIES: hypothetical protein [unclassified Butyricicoccus]RHS38226.1 hypothetical protein DWV55_01520 [Butyricicoccus sp. AF10-3]